MDETLKAEELNAIVQEIRDRVRARYPSGSTPDGLRLPLVDLIPLLHARDAAESKVASIGRVNPRRGGPLNSLAQAAKKLIARALDWHVREQVEFNRHILNCTQATLEALNENNRALAALSGRMAEIHKQGEELLREAEDLRDIRSHWIEWRKEWERKLVVNETQFLRSVADLQAFYNHRTALTEQNLQNTVKLQHADYLGALERATSDLQKRFWDLIGAAKREYEKLIHEELRLLRQRAALHPSRDAEPPAGPALDYGRFAERFRGPEEYVAKNVEVYRARFSGDVLDIGCGRGEFLEMMRSAGVRARGIDLSEECVALCRAKGLDVERADVFDYLVLLPDRCLDGIFCAQVVEHLPPERLPELVSLAAAKLRVGGHLAIETPNPECLAIFATHFYLDPTHTRPVPHPLLAFYMEEAGLGGIEVMRLSPAVDSFPALAELPSAFRDTFFGGLDYAIFGAKL